MEYSTVQIKEIESNKYVEKCTSKQIRFTNECKIEVLKLADKGMFHREVFHKLGFPEYVVLSKVPGYYKYKKKVSLKMTKENKEKGDVKSLKALVFKYKMKYGYRIIVMKLRQSGTIMNHKKVLRLMKKYGLLSVIRKKNPYAKIRKATQERSKKIYE